MSNIDLSKKLLDNQPELTLDECMKLAEAVKLEDWDKEGRCCYGKLDNIRIKLFSPDNNFRHPYLYSLEIYINGKLVTVQASENAKNNLIEDLYLRVIKLDENKNLLKVRDYIKSL